jgi:DNA-directed DNA polymerase
MKKLVIIDGKSVFYRGYYAMGNLATSKGEPTSGVYGFAVIAMEIVRNIQPDQVVVAWDKARTSTAKRLAIFKDYKAGRVRPPEDFYAQIPLLRELISALSWGFMEADEYEADDIIGTLARQADEAGDYMTYIVSSDLDMLQIVDENTKMYRILRGFSDLEEMDISAIEEKYGILKSQFLDLKALKGDNSDNIPGVPGIGEKTAVKLLNEYGSLEGIYAHIEEISGATQKKLIAGRESAEMSLKLAKIMTDAPVRLSDVPALKLDFSRISEVFKRLEFNNLLKKLKIENGLSDKDAETEVEEVSRVEIPEGMLVASNIKDLMHENAEFRERVFQAKQLWDLDQADFLLNPLRRTGVEGVGAAEEALSGRYTEATLNKFSEQYLALSKDEKLNTIFTELDMPVVPILYKMEAAGILLDQEYFKGLKTEFEGKVCEIEQKIYELSGEQFNVNSPLQMSQILFEKLNLPVKGIKKTSRGYSTGAKELEKLKDEHPVIAEIIRYRETMKLLSTYIAPLLEQVAADGRIHSTFTQNVTATGRLSSLNPNLQNIPVRSEEGKRIRRGFVAPEGKVLVSADYSQFELRLAAVLAGDETLVSDFNHDIDIHTKTAAEVYQIPMEEVTKMQRRVAKVINFGIMYGMSPKGLSDATEMNFFEAKRFIDEYFKVRQKIYAYLNHTLEEARETGEVRTFYGRKRPTPDVKSSNFIIRNAAERAAQNMPIQGTEADLMKRAMIAVDKKLPEGAKLVLQIHDSLVVECDKSDEETVKEILQKEMEGVAPELKIKLKVEVTAGQNLGEL